MSLLQCWQFNTQRMETWLTDRQKDCGKHVLWEVGAVVRVDDEILLTVEKTLSHWHCIATLLLQQTQKLSVQQHPDK